MGYKWAMRDEETAGTPAPATGAEARELIASNPVWYHVLELGPGLLTPGWFDLRPIVDRMPWPDVAGKRCLDVGPYDGFLSFELERRGAAEVVAVDIGDAAEWDWALRERRSGPHAVSGGGDSRTGRGFEIAKQLLGSQAERREISVYDVSPESVGSFDVVVCGSLLLHLKSPIAALEAIRSVCTGHFLSAEQIDPALTALQPRRPAAFQKGGLNCQWWIPNAAAHRAMVAAAGFEIERTTKPYSIPLGEAHRNAETRPSPRERLRLLPGRVVTGGHGVPHAALLARPGAIEA
jgi:tRNA (mo5U34)-methyltransferase